MLVLTIDELDELYGVELRHYDLDETNETERIKHDGWIAGREINYFCNAKEASKVVNPARLERGKVIVSLCDGYSITFISGTQVLLRDGTYKSVDVLSSGDLLMTSAPIESNKHIGEVLYVQPVLPVYSSDNSEDDDNFVDIKCAKNFEFKHIFIKSEEYKN